MVIPPIAWDCTPEQANSPGKLICHLIEGCLVYSDENQQLLALTGFWSVPIEPQFSTLRDCA